MITKGAQQTVTNKRSHRGQSFMFPIHALVFSFFTFAHLAWAARRADS